MADVGLVESRNHRANGNGRSSARAFNEIGFHALRHTATSLMKNAGISPAVVQDIIGHDSPAVSAQYTHIDGATKRKALDAMPDFLR
jgi:integrase